MSIPVLKWCLLGNIHLFDEKFSIIRAKENFRLAPSKVVVTKNRSNLNICIENTHPGLFLPLSCRWNYQSSVQVGKETNKEQTNKKRKEAQTSEEQIPNKVLQYLLDPEMAPLFPKYHYCGLYHTAYIEHRYKQRNQCLLTLFLYVIICW